MNGAPSFRIAAVQAAPVFLDLERTIDKACALIDRTAAEGADLVVFPEAFVPAYPVWVWFIPSGKTHRLRALYAELHRNSITIPGPATRRLGEAAAQAGVIVAIGVNERDPEAGAGTLYNTLLLLGRDGSILGRHRKLIPTSGERLVWGRGDGSDLEVVDAGFARIGGLICWENYMPLARQTLYAWGEQVHLAPTWDHGEPWLSSMRHIAKESRCVVVGCCQALRAEDIPDRLGLDEDIPADDDGWINPGDSVIVDPDGKLLAGPAHAEETILYADVEADQLVAPRWQLDVAGHYSRPDVFELRFHGRATPQVHRVTGLEEVEPPDAETAEDA